MLYTAQVRFEGNEVAARIVEAIAWFKSRGLPPGPFKYRITADSVRMRVDFADLIPSPIDQNRYAQSRNPIDMIVQGWSTRLFQAKQQCSRMSA